MSYGDTKDNENPPSPPFGKGGLGGFSNKAMDSCKKHTCNNKGNKEKTKDPNG